MSLGYHTISKGGMTFIVVQEDVIFLLLSVNAKHLNMLKYL